MGLNGAGPGPRGGCGLGGPCSGGLGSSKGMGWPGAGPRMGPGAGAGPGAGSGSDFFMSPVATNFPNKSSRLTCGSCCGAPGIIQTKKYILCY